MLSVFLQDECSILVQLNINIDKAFFSKDMPVIFAFFHTEPRVCTFFSFVITGSSGDFVYSVCFAEESQQPCSPYASCPTFPSVPERQLHMAVNCTALPSFHPNKYFLLVNSCDSWQMWMIVIHKDFLVWMSELLVMSEWLVFESLSYALCCLTTEDYVKGCTFNGNSVILKHIRV